MKHGLKKGIVSLILITASSRIFAQDAAFNSGDTAWMLASTMLVILMSIPAIGLFYGGMGRAKNMLSVLIQSFVIYGLISVLWMVYGYTLAFGGSTNAIWGGFGKLFLQGVNRDAMHGSIPEYVWIAFQSTFAAITCCLIVGAFAERMKFSAVLIFMVIWFTFCYVPIAHVVWDDAGFLAKDGAMDYAGGTVVHINAGVAGLIGACLVGKRLGYGKEVLAPHSVTLTMVGAALLWIGWFGFNAGSASAANAEAGVSFINTIVAPGAGIFSWLAVEMWLRGKASMLGAASGAVAGLVGVTPAAGFVSPMASIIIGLFCGVAGFWGVNWLKKIMHVDDAFDVFGVHAVCGILGAVLTGIFAAPYLGGTGNDDFFGPAAGFNIMVQVWIQVKSILITVVWTAFVSLVAYKIASLVTGGLRVTPEEERMGLDLAQHGEVAYRY